jgi:formylglycine-generating enzyme
MKPFKNALALVLVSCGMMAVNASAQFALPSVVVGNPGNANSSGGFGAVADIYSIGRYEVTLNQYASFLNHVAADDTYSLYNANMAANVNIAGITRSGSPGSYTYSVTGSGNRPVTYVSWFDAARYVNWLGNGQLFGAEQAGTTETGTYTLNGATSGIGFTRNANLTYALPSENEWVKAAYYRPVAQGGPSGTGGYYSYPTTSSTLPDSRPSNSTYANSANFYYNDGSPNGYNGGYAVNNSTALPPGSALTDAGAYTLARSYYGAFDQAGNAAEWTDGVFGSSRVVRGGSWGDANLALSSRITFNPAAENQYLGFRIAIVPEPSVIGSMALGLAMLVWGRKRAL